MTATLSLCSQAMAGRGSREKRSVAPAAAFRTSPSAAFSGSDRQCAQINIEAGHGGDAFGSSSGGAGGTATNIFVGYDLFGTTPTPSTNLSSDNVLVETGAGGAGKTGGKGGLLSNVNLRVSTPVDLGDELSLIAGQGGAATSALTGSAGIGGSVQHIQVLNEIATPGSEILLQAGSGGTTTGLAVGAAGGSDLDGHAPWV